MVPYIRVTAVPFKGEPWRIPLSNGVASIRSRRLREKPQSLQFEGFYKKNRNQIKAYGAPYATSFGRVWCATVQCKFLSKNVDRSKFVGYPRGTKN